MQPSKPQFIDPGTVKANLAAAEREAQFVNQEQIMAAALFAKQLRADLNGIRSAAVGEGLKVGDVDIAKVMPSEILRAYKPVNVPNYSQPVAPTPAPVQPQAPVHAPVPNLPTMQAIPAPVYASPAQEPSDPNQLELNFNKVTRYEEVVEAIERLETKINILTAKVNEVIVLNDKKKLKTDLDNGT
jgi:hypothetical protein